MFSSSKKSFDLYYVTSRRKKRSINSSRDVTYSYTCPVARSPSACAYLFSSTRRFTLGLYALTGRRSHGRNQEQHGQPAEDDASGRRGPQHDGRGKSATSLGCALDGFGGRDEAVITCLEDGRRCPRTKRDERAEKSGKKTDAWTVARDRTRVPHTDANRERRSDGRSVGRGQRYRVPKVGTTHTSRMYDALTYVLSAIVITRNTG